MLAIFKFGPLLSSPLVVLVRQSSCDVLNAYMKYTVCPLCSERHAMWTYLGCINSSGETQ